MDTQRFLDMTERFPESPGVYLMLDGNGVPLYIGKAVNLKSRVRSYFVDAHADRPRIPHLLPRVHTIDWIATGTETEALILEANLIRKHTPKFNVDLKDDKHFPYLKVTLAETFPRLAVSRRVDDDGAAYFGPYTDVGAMRRMADFGRRIFGICGSPRRQGAARPSRPCISYSMGRCAGACVGKIDREHYRRNIDMLLRFLRGHRRDLAAVLTARMEEASARQAFEQAALYRDQIRLITDASRQQQVDLKLPDTDADVFGLYQGDQFVCLAVLFFREGVLLGRRLFIVKRSVWDADAGHDSAIPRFYLDSAGEIPDEVVVPYGRGFDPAILGGFFIAQYGAAVRVVAPRKGRRVKLVEMAENNARLYLAQKAPADPADDLEELRKALHLPRLPLTIEAFDISNLGESFAVGASVRFTGGVPDKSAYRRYRIRTVEGQDDFAMMLEVVRRRLARCAEDGGALPDLLLIDGGKGQLHAAMEPLKGMREPPMIVSLAKREELIFSPYAQEPLALPAAHRARRLLQRIRDEVHRFAITYHRAVRGKRFGASSLEALPGIGPKKARELLRRFGSLQRVKEAPVEEIANVKGFSEKTAAALKRRLERG